MPTERISRPDRPTAASLTGGRRRLLLLLPLLTALLLQGCGFKLRTPASYRLPASISPLLITGLKRNDVLLARLESDLQAAGVALAQDQKKAASVLSFSPYRGGRRVTALDERGKAAEYEIREAITFALAARNGEVLVPKQEVSALRTYTDTRDRVLGKEGEALSLRAVLREDLAEQVMRRLVSQLAPAGKP